jgi:phage-related protein
MRKNLLDFDGARGFDSCPFCLCVICEICGFLFSWLLTPFFAIHYSRFTNYCRRKPVRAESVSDRGLPLPQKRTPASLQSRLRPLGRGLWEVRSTIAQGRTARVIFCVDRGQMFLLHGFIKKTRRTPPPDIGLALKRMKGQER